MLSRHWRTKSAISAAAIPIIVGSLLGGNVARAALGATVTTITVGAGSTGPVPGDGIGMNAAVWDGHLQDGVIPGLLQGAGVGMLRFPGGSTADVYHWQTNSITPGQSGYADPNNTFDRFMTNVVQPSGSRAMVTVNYGSNATGTGGGDPSEAAAWVRDANITHQYNVKDWEIGNEVYGNGYYGASWETDLHSDHSPSAYATNALTFISAMKAVDPTIKVGLVLTAPGQWPDGQGPEQWNPTVLSIACQEADFVSVHWYPQSPGQESDAGLLSSSQTIPGMVARLRSELNQYCGSHASQVGIRVTESNSVSYNPGKQTTSVINGLFAVQNYLAWLQAGVDNVDWWDLHNGSSSGNNNSSTLAGSTTYGDYGVLSSGSSGEPAANTPFPSYSGLHLLHQALVPGSHFLSATSGAAALTSYALQHPDGSVSVVVVNTDSSNAYTVSPSLAGWSGIGAASATTFSLAAPTPTTASVPVTSGTVTMTVPPYSATVLTVTPNTGSVSTATVSPTATASPSVTMTPVPTATSTPSPTATSTPIATMTPSPTATLAPSGSTVVLGNFEGSTDGFQHNGNVTNYGPSSWSPTVALGSYSLWTQYNIPSPWAEAQVYKWINQDLSGDSTLSASVFAKTPTTSTGVQVAFMVQGSDGNWYTSPFQSVPTNTRTTIRWTISGVPRAPMKMVYICWQFTTPATSSGNELWVDDIQAAR